MLALYVLKARVLPAVVEAAVAERRGPRRVLAHRPLPLLFEELLQRARRRVRVAHGLCAFARARAPLRRRGRCLEGERGGERAENQRLQVGAHRVSLLLRTAQKGGKSADESEDTT